jgi:surfactin synthase thioesterase subunit
MHFFSGFSLTGESHFFNDFLKNSEYCVAGFSYGAIKALEYVLALQKRIDTLQLFSPAFFQDRSEKFRRLQMMAYKKDSQAYLKTFMDNCFAPQDIQKVSRVPTTQQELERLLYYVWDAGKLEELTERGIKIEVYLGSEDRIINSKEAKEFFLPYATTYMINGANHFLQRSESD